MGRTLEGYLRAIAARLDNRHRVYCDGKVPRQVRINYGTDLELYKLLLEMRRTVLRNVLESATDHDCHDHHDNEYWLVFKILTQKNIFMTLYDEAVDRPGVDEYAFWIMMAFKGVKSMCSKPSRYSKFVKVDYGPFPEVGKLIWKMHDAVPDELIEVEDYEERKVAYLTFKDNSSAEKFMKYFRKDRQ